MSTHAGLDRSAYPGDQVMQWLWDNTNLAWTGFYLAPAPSHSDASWMSKRSLLLSMGWGFAPIYVGQQAQGPGSHILTAAQGRIDAQEAATRAAAAGFPRLSVVFLDVEQGPPVHQPAIDYWTAWANEMWNNTDYYAGVYCSHSHVANDLHSAFATPFVWVFRLTHTCDHTADPGLTHIPSGTVDFPKPNPASSGVSFAKLWQYVQSNRPTKCSVHGVSDWDFSSAVTLDPSTPESDPDYGFPTNDAELNEGKRQAHYARARK